MDAYLSHHSALAHLPLPLAQDYFRAKITSQPAPEVTIFHATLRRKKKGYKVHSCSLKVPAKYKQNHQGKPVVSPEFLFLQLAATWPLHELILLGILLCSKPKGPRSEAATTRERLEDCARSLLGHRGRPKALRAVKYIKDGCCSIMEALMHMFLSLPNLLGGHALKGAVFNHPVRLGSEERKAMKKNYCYIDLCFLDKKIAIEYQGAADHDGESNIAKDSLRLMALGRMGYTVLFVTKAQLYSMNEFKLFLLRLSELLGKRIRIRTDKFAKALAYLRKLLPCINGNANRRTVSPQQNLNATENHRPNSRTSAASATVAAASAKRGAASPPVKKKLPKDEQDLYSILKDFTYHARKEFISFLNGLKAPFTLRKNSWSHT